MQVFLAGTPVTVNSEFFDRSGNPLEVASATYRVLGNAGEELQAEVALFGDGVEVITPKQPEPPTPDVPADQGQEQVPPTEEVQPTEPEPESEGDVGVVAYSLYGARMVEQDDAFEAPVRAIPQSVTIPAELNTIVALDPDSIEGEDVDVVSVRELRTVEFRLKLVGGNVVLRKVVYALEPSDVLITGLNSFQTYSEAELVALSIPSLPGWEGADEQARIAALIEARLRINRLQFRDVSRGQNHLGGELLVGDLSLLAPRDFKNLSARLRAALCKAQVAEADTLLGGDPESERRRSGLVHETVGESAQTWRASKPLELPVSRKALSYLSGFITMSRKVGRS